MRVGDGHNERIVVPQRALQHGRVLRRLVCVHGVTRDGRERRLTERNPQRRRVEHAHDSGAFSGSNRIEQPDDVGNALGGAHAHRPHHEFAAFLPVNREAQQLRRYQAAQQDEHHARKQRTRQQAHYFSTSTGTAST